MAQGIVFTEIQDIHNRLAELGLEEARLRDAVRRGQFAWSTCTANHPPLIPGIWAWGETVRALREYVLTIGWSRSDENNYSVVLSPDERIAIAVATGDEGTGRAYVSPSTKAPKGPSTVEAVAANQLLLDLFEALEPRVESSSGHSEDRATWILLIHRTQNEVRCELSLPSSIGDDGRIDGWQERILLTPVPVDNEPTEVLPPPMQDVEIEIKRRQA